MVLLNVLAMDMAKNMTTQKSQFWLWRKTLVQSNMIAVCPRWFEFLTTLAFGALRVKHWFSPT